MPLSNEHSPGLMSMVRIYNVRWKKAYEDLFIYVLLTVHIGIIFVNNQLDVQLFFMYVYFHSLHVSGSHVQIWMRLRLIQTCTPNGVLWVAYATHNTLKSVPKLPRQQQTTVRCNGYQML
jgi:hypothetical protein